MKICQQLPNCRKGKRGRCACDPGVKELGQRGREVFARLYADPGYMAAHRARRSAAMHAYWTEERRAASSRLQRQRNLDRAEAGRNDPIRNRLLARLRAAGLVR